MRQTTPRTSPADGENAAPNPAARRVRIGFGILMVVVFLLVAAVAVLLPAKPSSVVTAPSKVPTASVEPTAPPLDPAQAAVEAAIRGFYATVDASKPVTTSAYVDREGRGGPAPALVPTSGVTTFRIARAVVGSGTADVYGRESRSVISTGGAEIEFRLRLVEKVWLISSWQIARQVPVQSQSLALTDVTARDIVSTLLRSRQVGDTTTMMMLTTANFRAAHASWFDGTDRTALLSSWKITAAESKGTAYNVTVREEWLPEPLTSTYTVVITRSDILVDAWTWK